MTGYAYNKKEGYKVPIEYVCVDCDYKTFNKAEEEHHYFVVKHYLKSTFRDDLKEKWDGVSME